MQQCNEAFISWLAEEIRKQSKIIYKFKSIDPTKLYHASFEDTLFAEGYCHDHWSQLNGDWTDFNDRSGNTANIGKVANFSTKESCIAAFSQIVENCYDGWDGGQWVADGILLNINFCKWSSETKRVRYEGRTPPAEAKRVRYEELEAPAGAKRVRYEGLPPLADAKRVRYEGLPPPADAKRVAYQGLRVGVDL
ncbi:hypothetical protein EYC80_004313 [Monilinia laxa]|uniref:Uncharacterized protein n=1 Tax=Monilinia laxa TaxID=61186 RepID=A0A5N6KN04_MONLA|nr:hypothetical protein EYC80_004313 [Monilinia laxa]